jgi:hypothetical protein
VRSGELARQRTHTLDESLLVDDEGTDRPVVEFLGSTPGRMALIAVALIAAVLAAGIAASTTVADRRDRLETLRSHTEPAQFMRLDNALRDEIGVLRDRQPDGIVRTYTALSMPAPGASAIGVLAALAIAAGIWSRLSEYH